MVKPIAVLSLVALFGISYADDAALKQALQRRYAEISRAFAARDVPAFEAVFSMNYSGKAPGRPSITRAEMLKDFESQMRLLFNVHWTQTIKSVKMEGSVVHTVIDSQMTGLMIDPKKVQHRFKLEAKGTKNDWMKGSRAWQVVRSETTDLKFWLDGKLLPPRAR